MSAVRSGARVEMRILDNGKGIPAQLLNQIFEPFFTTRSQGTGLGLAVVQSVVRAHQGEVGVASVPGEGTCFTLSFPLHQQAVRLGGVA
ncbi:Sensor protein ZraS [compost metagenome]